MPRKPRKSPRLDLDASCDARRQYEQALREHDERVGIRSEARDDFAQRVADSLGKYVTVVPAAESAAGFLFFERLPRDEIIALVDGSLLYAFGDPDPTPVDGDDGAEPSPAPGSP